MAFHYNNDSSSNPYGTRPRYPMASGAFNPRSPPNVVPTASLLHMAPGSSLRNYATAGGHGLPSWVSYQQQRQHQLSPSATSPTSVHPHHLHQQNLMQHPCPPLMHPGMPSPSGGSGVVSKCDTGPTPPLTPGGPTTGHHHNSSPGSEENFRMSYPHGLQPNYSPMSQMSYSGSMRAPPPLITQNGHSSPAGMPSPTCSPPQIHIGPNRPSCQQEQGKHRNARENFLEQNHSVSFQYFIQHFILIGLELSLI